MKKTLTFIVGGLSIILICFGLYRLVSKGVISFQTKDLAGIIFIVGIIIYFLYMVIKGMKQKDTK